MRNNCDLEFDFEIGEVVDVNEKKRRTLLFKIPLPYLTTEERKLPRESRKLVIVSKKCVENNKFELVSPIYLRKLFQDSEDRIPRFAPSQNDIFYPTQYSYGDTCVNFHLHWAKQDARIHFMKNWLTASVKLALTDAFQRIELSNAHKFERKMVVAQWIVDQCWYRGLVLKVEGHFVRIYYIDQGNVEIQSVETLRIIPDELTKIPPMAFRASLADTNLSTEDEARKYGETQINFILKLKSLPILWCRIRRITMDVDVNGHGRIGEVSLSRSSGIRFGLDQAVVILSEAHSGLSGSGSKSKKKWHTLNEMVRNDMAHEIFKGPVMFRLDIPLPDEENILRNCHRSDEISIQSRTPSFKEPSLYRIVHAVHPHLFYVEEASGSELALSHQNDASMQDFYSNFGSNFEDYIIRTHRVFLGRHYVWRMPESRQWYRVKVVRVDTPLGKCFVYLVDVGKELLVNIQDMMELKAEFSLLPARAMKVHLAHVTPVTMIEPTCVWPEPSKVIFQKLAKETPHFHGIALKKERISNEIAYKVSDTYEGNISVGVILIDQNFRNGYTLQARLRLLGVVESDGFATGTNHLAYLCYEGIPSYSRQFMVESVQKELRENGNLVFLDCYQGQTENRLQQNCNIGTSDYFKGDSNIQPLYEERGNPSESPYVYPYDRDSPCDSYHSKNLCLKFIPPLQSISRYRRCIGNMPVEIKRNDGPFTKLFGTHMGAVRISHVDGPGVFYIQMANKMDELYLLMDGIGDVIGNFPICSLENIKSDEFYVGSLVAVQVENELQNKILWHRAYIYSLLMDKEIAKVILTDFGGLMNVNFNRIRSLPDYFWCIPSYCHRAHLDFKSSAALRNFRWTSRMNEIWKDFVALNPQTTFLASSTSSVVNGQVEVEDYGQDLFFEASKNQWYAGGDLIDYPIIPRDDDSRKLLYHLLHSYGINLWYEDPTNDNSDQNDSVVYYFTSVEYLFL